MQCITACTPTLCLALVACLQVDITGACLIQPERMPQVYQAPKTEQSSLSIPRGLLFASFTTKKETYFLACDKLHKSDQK